MKNWKEKWAQLSDAEKRAYSTKAANVAGDVTNLSIRQRQNQVAKIMRVIQRYVSTIYSALTRLG